MNKTLRLFLAFLLIVPPMGAQEENTVVVTTTDDIEQPLNTREVESIRFEGGKVVLTQPWGSTVYDRTLRALTFLRPLPGTLRLTVSSSIHTQQNSHRALGLDNDGRVKSTWEESDMVYVYANETSTTCIGTLIPLNVNVANSVLIGDIARAGLMTGQNLYLTTKPRPSGFAVQTGTLAGLFNAMAKAPVTINGANAEMPDVVFENPQSITCFTVKDGYGQEVAVSAMTITGGAEDISVTMAEPSSQVFVAMPATTEKTTYSFTAITPDNKVRAGTKKANVQDGKYYTADVTMKLIPEVTAPAAKELHYDGEPQSLVEAATSTGGTIMYRQGDGTYSESIPCATEIGDYIVYYKVVGDADCHNVDEASVSVNIGRGLGTIEFYADKVGQRLGSGEFLNRLVVVGDGAVSYTSDNTEIATVNDTTGVVTAWKAGETTITATVANGEKYDYAQNTAQYDLKVGSIITNIGFTQRRIDKTYGDGSFTNELVNGGDGVVTYTSSAPEVATVNATTGEVNIVGAGSSYIVANVADGTSSLYDIYKAQFSLTVQPADPALSLTTAEGSCYRGAHVSFNASMNAGYDGTLSVKSSDESVATATLENGVVSLQAHKGGTAVIYVTAPETRNWREDGKVYMLYVNDKYMGSISYELDVNKKYDDAAFTNPLVHVGDGEVSYVSSNPGVATVDADGQVTIKGVGTTTIRATVAEGATYAYPEEHTAAYNLTVDRGTPAVTAPSAKSLTYSGNDQDLVRAASVKGGTVRYQMTTSDSKPISTSDFTAAIPTATNVGTYYVWYYVQGDGNHNDTEISGPVSVKVNRKPLTITANAQTKTYGTEISTGVGQVTSTGMVSGHSVSAVTLTPSTSSATTSGTITPSAVTIRDGGNNDVTDNYAITYHTGALTINKAASSVASVPVSKSLTYNGSDQVLVDAGEAAGGTMRYQMTTTNSKPGSKSGFSASIPTATDASTYYVWYYAQGDGNHNDTDISGPVSVSVGKKALTIMANAQTKTYGDDLSTGVGQVTASGLENDHSVSAVTLMASTTDVTSSGTITPSEVIIKDGNDNTVTKNYAITYQPGTLIVRKAASSVTSAPVAKSLTYSGSDQSLVNAGEATGGTLRYKMTTTNSKPSGTSGFTASKPVATNADTYYVWYYVEGDGNHDNSDISGPVSVSIGKKTLTITANDQTKTYGTAISTGTSQVNADGLVSGHSVSAVTLAQSTTSVTSNGTITPSGVTVMDGNDNTVTDNYAVTYHVGTLIINKVMASITTVPTAKSLTYTSNSQSLVNAGEATGGTLRYKMTTSNIKPSGTSGFTTSIPTATNAGTYYVWYYVQGDGNNEDSEIGSVSASIKRKSLTITANGQTMDYGGSLSTDASQVTISGLVSGHSVTSFVLTPSTTDVTTSGTIKPSSAVIYDGSNNAVTSNYSISYRTGALTVNKTASSVASAPTKKSLTYSGSDQSLVNAGGATGGTLRYKMTTSNSQPSGTSGFTTSIPTATNAGTYYVWYYVQGDGNHNDSGISGPVSVSVGKKTLTITAKSQTQNYGTSISVGTSQITTSGLVSGHYVNSVSLAQSTTSVTSNGTITPSAATILDGSNNTVTSNYSISYQTGNLTINSTIASVSIAPSAKSLTYSGSAKTLANAGQANGGTMYYQMTTTNSKPSGTSGFTSSIPTATNAGTYYVWYYVLASSGYLSTDVCTTPVTVTISPKPMKVFAKGQTMYYGTPVYTGISQINADGLVSGHSVTDVTITASTTEVTNNGTVTPSAATVKDGSGNNVTANYSISYVASSLRILAASYVKVAPAAKHYVYDGFTHALVSAGQAVGGTMMYKMTTTNSKPSSTSGFSSAIPYGNQAGSYYVWYYVKGEGGLPDSEICRTPAIATISQPQVNHPTIELSETSYTYDGTEKKPSVTVKYGDKTIPTSEYTVSYSNNVNAGTATVTISDKDGGNYTVYGTRTFVIKKAKRTVSVSPRYITMNYLNDYYLDRNNSAYVHIQYSEGVEPQVNVRDQERLWVSNIYRYSGEVKYRIENTTEKAGMTYLDIYIPGDNNYEPYTENGAVTISTPEQEYVDLGLSVKWATHNVGAHYLRSVGNTFCWGGTVPGNAQSPYSNSGPTSLPLSHDAASVRWGTPWRMPTREEVRELIENCDIDTGHESYNHGKRIWGYMRCTSKMPGYEGKYIDFPLYYWEMDNIVGGLEDTEYSVHYWTSTPINSGSDRNAVALMVDATLWTFLDSYIITKLEDYIIDQMSRNELMYIRPVRP